MPEDVDATPRPDGPESVSVGSAVLHIPEIDFDEPSDVPLVGIRKGFGIGSIGGGSPTGPAAPPARAESD